MLIEILVAAGGEARRKCGIGVIALLCAGTSLATGVTLSWEPSSDIGVAGYNLYYGSASGSYTNIIAAGPATSLTIPLLAPRTTYYFAATSYDDFGVEGPFSLEASYTVPAENRAPTLDPIADIVVNENAATQSIDLTGISAGSVGGTQSLIVNAISSNQTLIPNPIITYTTPNSMGVLTFVPIPGGFGWTTVSVVVDNGGISNNTVVRSFTITVNAQNQPPTLDPVADVVVNENSGVQTINLSGIASGATNELQSLTVTAVSSNPSLIPTPTIDYTSPNSFGTLTFAAVTNRSGSATVVVTVDDGTAANNRTSRSFNITVNQPASRPVLQISGFPSVNLTVLGQIGISYQLEFATSIPPTLIWFPLLNYTQTNATQTFIVGATNPLIFYRAVQQ